jgi:uncharacterized membrane protein YdbT with pleckstrin-like domain
MPFPRKLLTGGEQIVLDLRPHWKALIAPLSYSIIIGGATGAVYIALLRNQTVRYGVIAVAFVVWMIVAGVRLARWRFTEFVLTNERIIHRSGVVAKVSKEIPLERVNDVTVTQSVLDRMFRAGTITLESAGEHGQADFDEIRHPVEVQKRIYEAAEARKGMSRPGGVADELEKLAALRDRGVLSEQEFQERKRLLLQ